MRVLVTGGAGFIGSHVCDRLAAQGHRVVAFDDLSSGTRQNLRGSGAELVEGSILDVEAFASSTEPFDLVFHLAAKISGHDSLFDPESYFSTNVDGTVRLLRAAKKWPGVRIVFASSSTVYGGSDEEVKREDQVPSPLSVYALTKLAGEHLLSLYAPLYGFDWVALRLFNVYGPRQSPTHPYANVTCKFAHAAATGRGVRLYGDGLQQRDFVFVDDVVDAMLTVARGCPRRIYNVGTGVGTPILDLLRLVERIGGAPLAVENCGPWPNDIRRIRADVSRIERDCGLRSSVGLQDGLTRTIEWFRQQGPA